MEPIISLRISTLERLPSQHPPHPHLHAQDRGSFGEATLVSVLKKFSFLPRCTAWCVGFEMPLSDASKCKTTASCTHAKYQNDSKRTFYLRDVAITKALCTAFSAPQAIPRNFARCTYCAGRSGFPTTSGHFSGRQLVENSTALWQRTVTSQCSFHGYNLALKGEHPTSTFKSLDFWRLDVGHKPGDVGHFNSNRKKKSIPTSNPAGCGWCWAFSFLRCQISLKLQCLSLPLLQRMQHEEIHQQAISEILVIKLYVSMIMIFNDI